MDANKEIEGIVKWIRDWFDKNGPKADAVIGLSGGSTVNAVPGEARAELAGMIPLHLMAGAAPLCAELGCTCRVEETEAGARLIVTGKGCHAAQPETGINARVSQGNSAMKRRISR